MCESLGGSETKKKHAFFSVYTFLFHIGEHYFKFYYHFTVWQLVEKKQFLYVK